MGACQAQPQAQLLNTSAGEAASDDAICRQAWTVADRGTQHHHPGICLGRHLMGASSVTADAPAEPQGCFCSIPDVPEDRSGGSMIQLPGDSSPPSQQRHSRMKSGHGRQHAGSSGPQRKRGTQESRCTDAGMRNTPAAFAIDPGEAEPGNPLTVKSGPPEISDSKSQSPTSAPRSPPPHSDEDRAILGPGSSSPVTFSPASTALPQIATTAGPGA